jgi:MFS family permease
VTPVALEAARATGNKWVFLALACSAVVLSLASWFSATAIVPELITRWHMGNSAAAWLTNGVQAGFVVGALLSSVFGLPDRVAPHTLMALAATLAGVFTLSLLTEPGIGWAVCARFLTGLALAGVYPPGMKLLATWFQKGRGLAMGCLIGALTLGSALPHLVRGLGGGLDWRLVIGVVGGMSFVAALMFGLLLREGPYPFARGSRVDPRQVGMILRNRPVMAANFGYFGHMWELYAMWGWFLTYTRVATQQGLPLANVSILTFAVVAAGVPGSILGGVLSDRIGRCAATALIMILSGTFALLIGATFQGPLWLFMLVALFWGATVIADSAQFSAAVTELSSPEMVGSALAFQMGVGFALTIVVIWLLPLLAAVVGWQWVFASLAVGPFLGAWSMLRLRRMPESRAMAGGKR